VKELPSARPHMSSKAKTRNSRDITSPPQTAVLVAK
jgi:hypothetical protein